MKIACGNESVSVRLEGEQAVLEERSLAYRVHRRGGEIEAIETEGRIIPVRVLRQGEHVLVWCGGRTFELRAVAGTATRSASEGELVSPMPGRVRQVCVRVGDRIARGQVVLVLEAMKMEHAIRSPRDGVVASIAYKEGDLVEAGVRLVEIT